MLHLSIADKVWLDLMRGDLADAVFSSFRAVEEAVREAGGCGDAVIGVDLMRRAFDPKGGPLTDLSQEEGGAA
jgi:class 3 adenylate cyclase